ncbi:MAG: transglycosylase SLT domain-containing protein [Nanoarchaeota archaeon]|nr:transglycosylase SLT domain-containing protein [Nanoarchaeota archaeon]
MAIKNKKAMELSSRKIVLMIILAIVLLLIPNMISNTIDLIKNGIGSAKNQQCDNLLGSYTLENCIPKNCDEVEGTDDACSSKDWEDWNNYLKENPEGIKLIDGDTGETYSGSDIDDSLEIGELKSFNIDMAKQLGVEKEFLIATENVANALDIKPEHLLAVMAFETGGTFKPCIKNKKSGATGLIQFMKDTAEWLGTSQDELCKMTNVQQMTYVKKYFQKRISSYGKLDSLEKVYMAVLCPAAIKNPLLFSKTGGGACDLKNDKEKAYNQNSGLDINKDDKITRAEATTKVANRYESMVG